MALDAIAAGIYEAQHDLWMPGRVLFKTRMSVVELEGGELLLHSAVPLSPALRADLDALGRVAHIVVPNAFHNLWAAPAKREYPQARVWAPAAARARVPTLPIDGVLGQDEPPFAAQLQPFAVAGAPSVSEFVFHHPRSRSLLLTDLAFHIDYPLNFVTKLAMKAVGVYGRGLCQSRTWRFGVKDRGAYEASIARILDLDFRRVIPAHGSPVPDAGPEGLRAALARTLGEA